MRRPALTITIVLALTASAIVGLWWLLGDRGAARPLRAAGAPCRPELGFTPSPMPDPHQGPLVAHVERTRIAVPLATDLSYVAGLSLQRMIQKSNLPHVTGTFDLTPSGFGTTGSRRLTCLSDGSSLVEQVLLTRRTAASDRFRYMVWDYSSPQARPIHHAIGEFMRRTDGSNATLVSWTYSFALRGDRVPGIFGPPGRYAFRRLFLERGYAAMMRNTLAAEKAGAESSVAD